MTRPAEEESTSSAALEQGGQAGRPATQAEPQDIGPAPGSESNGVEPPSIDEIRLRAYYRYMERDGDADELADWLEAESELRGRVKAVRVQARRGEQP
jgi:Protein of unknown function (DUF2934)